MKIYLMAAAALAPASIAQANCPVAGRYAVGGELPGSQGHYQGEAVITAQGTGCHVTWLPPNDSAGSGNFDGRTLSIAFTFANGGSGIVRYVRGPGGTLTGVWWMNASPRDQGRETLTPER